MKVSNKFKFNRNHIIEVYRKYNFNPKQLLEIGNFINKNLFKEELSDSEIVSFSQRAKEYAIKTKSVINDENYNGDIDLICFDEVKHKAVNWLWYPYLPLGRLTLIVGDPGVGKSYLTIDWASRVSSGKCFPFYDEILSKDEIKPSKVIFQNGEDGIEDTIKERLNNCGANQKNIFIINEIDNPLFNLNDLERFEKALKEQRPKLIIIDPLQRYLGSISMNSANEVRQLLAPINNLAIKYDCAIVLVMHRNKSKTSDDVYRALGSIDFVGIARSMLSVIIDYETEEKKIVHTKSSLGQKGQTIIFDIDDNGVKYITQIDNYRCDINTLKPKEEAKEFILTILRENGGNFGATEISNKAKELDIASATLSRAKKELGVKSIQIQGKWYWELDIADNQSYIENNDNLIN